jgi:hypothetical protein
MLLENAEQDFGEHIRIKTGEVPGGERKLHNKEIKNLQSSQDISRE